jgi:hypothetical protein
MDPLPSTTYPLASYDRLAPNPFTAIASRLAQITLVGYLCQTALFAPVRYLLATKHLEMLWYVPDLLGLMCIAAVFITTDHNLRILVLLNVLLLYAIEGYAVSGSPASVLSTFKALVPLFCGLLLKRDLATGPVMRKILLLFWLAACGGVIYSMYETPPWSSLQFEGAGVLQAYKETQWTPGGGVRNYGFAGDQHAAASSILTLFILLSVERSRFAFCLLGTVSVVTVYLTTSRTNLFSLLIYVGLCLLCDLQRRTDDQFFLKWCLRASFLSVLVPAVGVGIALWYNAADVPTALLSLWIRGNETWLVPFSFINDLAPLAIFSGFGLGGIGFGLLQSNLSRYATTIDNFILFNFFTFGIPYLIFYLFQCRRMLFEQDPYRVIVFVVTAVSGLFLRGWSDYLFMILFGYATACVWRGAPINGLLRQSTAR